jgi:hypothetical protein
LVVNTMEDFKYRWETTLGDNLKQCGRGFGRQRQIPELVDRQQSRSGVEPHGGGPAALDRGAMAVGGKSAAVVK